VEAALFSAAFSQECHGKLNRRLMGDGFCESYSDVILRLAKGEGGEE